MAKQRASVRLQLTPEQQTAIKRAVGKDTEALELTVEELEERIAPQMGKPMSGG
jgi:hypothetical protein